MHLDVETLTLLVGTVIPLAVGLVTKLSAPSWVKAITNAILSGVAAVITLSIKHIGINVDVFLNTFLHAFIASAAAYYGFLKPTTIAPKVANVTGEVGIG